MILKYKTELKCVAIKACEHYEKGIIRRENLMQTDFIPVNFRALTKNYVLREGHTLWDSKLKEAEDNVAKEWLTELGYNPDGFEVNHNTKEITSKDNPHWNPEYHKLTGAVTEDKEVGSI